MNSSLLLKMKTETEQAKRKDPVDPFSVFTYYCCFKLHVKE